MTSELQNGLSPTTSDDVASMSALEVQTLEPNRNLLLNKIDRLQRTNVRLMEKMDFMHEHISQLTLELQKKTKILQVGSLFGLRGFSTLFLWQLVLSPYSSQYIFPQNP